MSLSLAACFSEESSKSAGQETDTGGYSGTQVADKVDYTGQVMRVLDIAERSYDGGNALTVTLSIPLDTREFHGDFFLLTHADQGVVAASPVVSENGKVVYFPDIEPDTKYRLTVHKGLAGIQGEPLAQSAVDIVTTRSIGANYRFLSQGAFLFLSQYKGLPIEIVNTPEINVDFFRVDPDKVPQFLNRNRYFREKTYRYDTTHFLKDTELVYSARYQFDAPKNKRREFNIPVRSVAVLNDPGVYLAVMSLPGDFQQPVRMTYFTATDIGMHVRVYPEQAEVLLTSLEDQKPLSDVKIDLLNEQGVSLYTTGSSPDGFATIPVDLSKGRYIVARDDSSYSIVEVHGPALDLSEHDMAMRTFATQELFLYGPRDLYRPGETVVVNGLLRDYDGKQVVPPTLKAILRRPDGSSAQHFTWQSKGQGFYHLAIPISGDAKTGLWTLDVANVGDKSTSYQFKIEEFLPERMKLRFEGANGSAPILNTQPFEIDILGEYLYGAPASQNRFEPRVFYRAKREPFDELKGFQFGDQDEQNIDGDFELADFRLDDTGKGKVRISSRWRAFKSPVEAVLMGSLFESGGRPVTRLHSTVLLPDNHLLGIKPEFEGNPPENSRVGFEIISTDIAGNKTQIADIEVALIREDRRYFWEFSNTEGWHYEWTEKDYPVMSSTFSTQSSGSTKVDFPTEYGSYRLVVKHPASGAFSSLRFFSGTDWYHNWRENQSGEHAAKPDMVSLAWNKESYVLGDIARLTIVPPDAGEATVLVESDSLLWSQRVTVSEAGAVVDIPIDEHWQRHDIHVSVIHLQYSRQVTQITPSRSIGLIHLPLNREQRRLEVAIEAEEKVVPNQTYRVRVKVEGQKQAHVTLAMVDVGVLSLTNFETPDPHQYFFEPRRFQVDARDIYQKLIPLNDSPYARQRFGGDAALQPGGENARSKVQIVSLFSGLVATDEQGYADIEFDIPDFNGKVRLMAVAFTEDEFGSAAREMTIAAPVVTQLSVPRFLANGDKSTLALDFHNLTETTQTMQVHFTASAPVSLSQTTSLTLEADAKTTMKYPIEVDTVGKSVDLALTVTGIKDYKVSRHWALEVRPAWPALTQSESKVLQQGQEFTFNVTSHQAVIPETFEGILTAGNSVSLNIQEQMDKLLRYPYGCLEQTISSTYPWLYATGDNILMQGQIEGKLEDRQGAVNTGLKRIRNKATGNGGYGLWSNTGEEQHWLTAYAGDFLTDARLQGAAVDSQLYDVTMSRLQDYARSKNGSYYNRWSQNGEHYDFAYRTYAAYVLSRHQNARLSTLRNLAQQSGKAQSPLPLVHLGLALINQGDNKAGLEIIQTSKSITRATGYLGDYGSALRDDALIVRLLLENNVETGYANQIAFDIAQSLQDKAYLSTQERNALLLAGIALEKQQNAPWQLNIELGDVSQVLKQAGSYVQNFNAQTLGSGLRLSNLMPDSVFVNLTYQGVPKQKPDPVSNGLTIVRNYYDLKGNKITPEKLDVGDLMLVGLQVASQQRHPDILIVDLLPAGLEIENQNLEHSINLNEFKLGQYSVNDWIEGTKIVHQEYRDDRFVAAIDLAYRSAAQVFYLVRAVTPGRYRVPAPLVEDMYRPQFHATGSSLEWIDIVEQ